MSNEIVLKTELLFSLLSHNHEGESWTFTFGTDYFTAEGFWRILLNKRITLVSFDDRQQFGLSEPMDLEKKVNEMLEGKILETIIITQNTADLHLVLNDGIEIEIFTSSSGYESFQFSFNRKLYIGQGSGDVAIF